MLGVPSDHSAILLKIKFKTLMKKNNNIHNNIDWDMFLEEDIKERFNDKLQGIKKKHSYELSDKSMECNIFSKFVMRAAKEVGKKENSTSEGWYKFSKDLLDSLMIKRTKILDPVRQGNFTSAQAKIMCRDARRILKEGISVAKSNWKSCLSEKNHAMSQNSRDSWKAINILKSWKQGHHKSLDIIRFEKDDGTFTVSDEEIIKIFYLNTSIKFITVILKQIEVF